MTASVIMGTGVSVVYAGHTGTYPNLRPLDVVLSAEQTKVAADEFNIDFSLACWSGDDLRGLVAILVKTCYHGLQTLVL
jgi:hypothetical protein